MTVTVFYEGRIFARGNPDDVAAKARDLPPLERSSDLLAFDDETGRQIDLDLRPAAAGQMQVRTRGRPALGVKAREVTLLPEHWDWLNAQRGGASAAIRRLVDAARAHGKSEAECRDSAYRFLSVMAGNLPHFESAMRELYAGNRMGYDHFAHDWPADVRNHGRALAWPEGAA